MNEVANLSGTRLRNRIATRKTKQKITTEKELRTFGQTGVEEGLTFYRKSSDLVLLLIQTEVDELIATKTLDLLAEIIEPSGIFKASLFRAFSRRNIFLQLFKTCDEHWS